MSAAVILYGYIADAKTLTLHIAAFDGIMPAQTLDFIQERLKVLIIADQSGLGVGLVVTLAIAFWSGSRGVSALVEMIGATYYESDGRSIITSVMLSLALLFAGAMVASIVIFAVTAVPVLLTLVPYSFEQEQIIKLARWPLLGILAVGYLMLIYRVGPSRRAAEWQWTLPGAIVASLLLLIGTIAFSYYVEAFGYYDATFGSMSTPIVLMMWIYYSSLIIGVGALFNAEIEHQTSVDTTVGPDRPMGKRQAFVADHSKARQIK